MKIDFRRSALVLLAAAFVAGCGTLPKRAGTVPPYQPDVEALDVSLAETNGSGSLPLPANPGFPARRRMNPCAP